MDLEPRANENWLEKPAIQWSEAITRTTDTVHWDTKLLEQLCTSATSNSISYRTLLRVALNVSTRLPVLRPDSVIVVAIPEGPCLPIAILAVHLCKDAILVPMEPSEGMERLKHMVQDSQPLLVLCLPGSDWTKMQQSISDVASDAQLINFIDLICQTLDPSDTCAISIDSCVVTSSIWETLDRRLDDSHDNESKSRISHIVYTSGTTGIPKGCVSSKAALRHYLTVKNEAHGITMHSTVLLASALSFDPCLSDILATVQARATLAIAPRAALLHNLSSVLSELHVTHVLCTPTLWSMVTVRPSITHQDDNDDDSQTSSLQRLQVVALGGEPIPKRLVHLWADRYNSVRLYATYGVTEACVYQTMGRVTLTDNDDQLQQQGQCVGQPFRGIQVRIVAEDDSHHIEGQQKQHELDGFLGEIVLSGSQLDHMSGYLNRCDLTQSRFVRIHETHYYKTGDRGYIRDGNLYVVGRIQGQDGMVKVNGVRIELGEIEAALIDDTLDLEDPHVVVDCLAIARPTDASDEGSPKQLYAFTVLSQPCIDDLGIKWDDDFRGVVVSGGPLLTLFRMRCLARLRKGTLPSVFVIIPRTPLSPTGKADRRNLPTLSECVPLERLNGTSHIVLLRNYGNSGTIVADVITDILNLQPCQQSMLTTCANFAMLGGDSLAATRVVRTLYADHHQIHNSRFLGGAFGSLEGVFSVSHLLLSRNLGEYVDYLDKNGIGRQNERTKESCRVPESSESTKETSSQIVSRQILQEYEALLEAISIGQTAIAIGLLNAGVDPNAGNHGGRLGKVSSRIDRKKLFTSNPLHVACAKGNPRIVRKLLSKGCKFNSPDASGNFPLHMTASGVSDVHDVDEDDLNRTECVKLLLNAGAPLSMKDGNKQTVLHAAARAGHCQMLSYLLTQWKIGLDDGRVKYYDSKHKGGKLDWLDKWYRTPVHWAVLNCRARALEVLLREGCSANPPVPSNRGASKGTSVQIESPIEIYQRLCNETDPKWTRIRELLLQFCEPS